MKYLIRLLCFLIGLLIIFIMAIASNSNWLNACEEYIPSPYRYGDLYFLSNMPGFKIKRPPKPQAEHISHNGNTTLTIIGDSYVAGTDSSFFSSESYRFINWDEIPFNIPALDVNKKNIIVIESAERYVWWRLIKNNLLNISVNMPQTHAANIELAAESNLQYMLTYFDWEFTFKELKTRIYLYCFDKFPPMVAKPDGSGRLYLSETVDPNNQSSSFRHIDEAEIYSIVQNLNTVQEQLLGLGFNEVYIAIIPNPSSLYKKSAFPYNHLIERIQKHSEIKFKCIDVYSLFKKETKSLYHINDSHWNDFGKTIWLSKLNSAIGQ